MKDKNSARPAGGGQQQQQKPAQPAETKPVGPKNIDVRTGMKVPKTKG